MPLPVLDSERALPSARKPPLAEAKAPPPAAGRPARPDIDLVPKSDRMPSERTVVMPNAPKRAPQAPPHPTRAAGAPLREVGARAPAPSGAGSGAPHFPPPAGSGARTFPSGSGSSPATFGAPQTARSSPPHHGSRPPPALHAPTTARRENRPAVDDARALEAIVRALESAAPPPVTSPSAKAPRAVPAPAQEHTVAMPRPHTTPSAPPVAVGATLPPQHGSRPPPNVRTRPLSFAPPANALLAPVAPSASVAPAPAPAPAPGVLGLVLFAAPLAFATMAVAALALL